MLYLNGKIISKSDAVIAPDDRGFLLGDGLFETLRCVNGKPLALPAHWERLRAGARYLELPLTISIADVASIIENLLRANKLNNEAAVRITITRGSGPRGIAIPTQSAPTVLITTFPIQTLTTAISLCTSDITINQFSPLTQFKTLHYLDKIVARQQACRQGFDDAILLNTKKRVVSTTTANLFFINNNILHTPALHVGALPGITRQQILTLAAQQKISIEEGAYSIDEVTAAHDVFISNSLIGMRLVKCVEKINFKDSPCRIYQLLSKSFKNFSG